MERITEKPLASVLLPVYNAEKYLREAIDSILNQTFSDFEFVIINDGSTDNSEKVILSYEDSRIKYLKNEQNIGLIKTLNKGIDLINTKYIIRMDADDISVPDRFEKQISYLEANPKIGVLGGNLQLFGNETGIRKSPESDNAIKAGLLFQSTISHPACAIRTAILKTNIIYYPQDFLYMEDYALWHRLKDITTFANLNTVILHYRIEGQNITQQKPANSTVFERSSHLYKHILSDFRIPFTNEDIKIHIGFRTNNNLYPSYKNLIKYRQWHLKLIEHNKTAKKYPSKDLSDVITQIEKYAFFTIIKSGILATLSYWFVFRSVPSNQLIYFLKYNTNKLLGRKK